MKRHDSLVKVHMEETTFGKRPPIKKNPMLTFIQILLLASALVSLYACALFWFILI